jgi:hypothetical protein
MIQRSRRTPWSRDLAQALRGILPAVAETPCEAIVRTDIIEILRLCKNFVSRSSCSAQDDNHLLASFTSDASFTGAGPEMPPSFRTRQKCTIISTEATIGIPIQCQI